MIPYFKCAGQNLNTRETTKKESAEKGKALYAVKNFDWPFSEKRTTTLGQLDGQGDFFVDPRKPLSGERLLGRRRGQRGGRLRRKEENIRLGKEYALHWEKAHPCKKNTLNWKENAQEGAIQGWGRPFLSQTSTKRKAPAPEESDTLGRKEGDGGAAGGERRSGARKRKASVSFIKKKICNKKKLMGGQGDGAVVSERDLMPTSFVNGSSIGKEVGCRRNKRMTIRIRGPTRRPEFSAKSLLAYQREKGGGESPTG